MSSEGGVCLARALQKCQLETFQASCNSFDDTVASIALTSVSFAHTIGNISIECDGMSDHLLNQLDAVVQLSNPVRKALSVSQTMLDALHGSSHCSQEAAGDECGFESKEMSFLEFCDLSCLFNDSIPQFVWDDLLSCGLDLFLHDSEVQALSELGSQVAQRLVSERVRVPSLLWICQQRIRAIMFTQPKIFLPRNLPPSLLRSLFYLDK